MDAVMEFVMQRWPVLAMVIIAVAVTIIACKWYFGRFVPTEKRAGAMESKLGDLDKLSKTVDNLPCTKHDESFAKIMEAIVEIRTFLMVKNPKTTAMFAVKHSPLRLNEEGEKLFSDISGRGFLDTNKEVLLADISGKMPKTALDVEELAMEVLYDHLDDDMFIELKQWVYNSPSRKMIIDGAERDYAVTMDDVCFVLSLPLRDMYLEAHPGLL